MNSDLSPHLLKRFAPSTKCVGRDERWIAEGKPLQISPQALRKRVHPKTALEIALETGQHSLTVLLLSRGYRQELERYRPLELALRTRRWDLFDLLLEWGRGPHERRCSYGIGYL